MSKTVRSYFCRKRRFNLQFKVTRNRDELKYKWHRSRAAKVVSEINMLLKYTIFV